MAEEKNCSEEERRQEVAHMARGLRRMKRQLLLKHVEGDQKAVGSLRDLMLKAAYGECVPTPPASPRLAVFRQTSSTPKAIE